jgi:hypothetical protein
MRSLVSYFANNALKHPAPGYWFTALQSQLEKVWKKPLYGHYGEEGMILDEDTNTRVLNTAVKFKNWPFFEKATSNLRGVLPLEYFTRLREQSAAANVPFRDIRNGYVTGSLCGVSGTNLADCRMRSCPTRRLAISAWRCRVLPQQTCRCLMKFVNGFVILSAKSSKH